MVTLRMNAYCIIQSLLAGEYRCRTLFSIQKKCPTPVVLRQPGSKNTTLTLL